MVFQRHLFAHGLVEITVKTQFMIKFVNIVVGVYRNVFTFLATNCFGITFATQHSHPACVKYFAGIIEVATCKTHGFAVRQRFVKLFHTTWQIIFFWQIIFWQFSSNKRNEFKLGFRIPVVRPRIDVLPKHIFLERVVIIPWVMFLRTSVFAG